MDQLPRLGKRELICLLLFTCNYVVFVWRSFLFLWVLGMDYVILLWHSLSLPYNYFLFVVTAAGGVPCGSPKKRLGTSSIVQFIFYFWSFEISRNVLRNQKIS